MRRVARAGSVRAARRAGASPPALSIPVLRPRAARNARVTIRAYTDPDVSEFRTVSMATSTLPSLRDRMTPPSARRPGAARASGVAAQPRPEVDRVLTLATSLFGVATAALVLVGPDGLTLEAASGDRGSADKAVDAALRLFEILAGATPGETGHPAGVMEEIVPGRGFLAATAILSDTGRCLGAVCLLDGGTRRTLLTGLQRRLFAEFGGLLSSALAAPPRAASDPAAQLQALADADPDAFALFDPDGRCLLRNARFDALVGAAASGIAAPGPGGRPELAGARGCEARWIAQRLARDVAPVGVYRAALADGTWLSVEERRGPHGRSLLARVETRDDFGSDGEMAHLFERCPFPMFVFDRDTRAVLAVNEAALALYGWDRDAFLRLDVGLIGPVDPSPADGAQGWTHRTRDGLPLPVAGRTIDLAHRGRPAVLVTVNRVPADAAAEQAA